MMILVEISKGMLSGARGCKTLPFLTVLFMFQLLTHHLSSWLLHSNLNMKLQMCSSISKYLLLLNLLLFLVPGYTLLIYLYKHSVTCIFNRKIPTPTSSLVSLSSILPSFMAHLLLLKPIEVLYRYLTYNHRMLPDIIVLGEVRCGTTTFCHHLATVLEEAQTVGVGKGNKVGNGEGDNSDDDNDNDNPSNDDECEYFIDCHTPFCLWSHPELDHKETFYFVGHYLGMVSPKYYSMCFPLYITKYWNEVVAVALRNNFVSNLVSNITCRSRRRRKNERKRKRIQKRPLMITFDGCAQYLSSPTAPYLIANAYQRRNQPPPILISCIRDPVEQTISWWKYENAAMEWGESMGLVEWNTDLRGRSYPPKTLLGALEYSSTDDFVIRSYERSEALFTLDSLAKVDGVGLPLWAMTWPGGQLTGIGRNGNFTENIYRYERVFDQAFSLDKKRPNQSSSNISSIAGKTEMDLGPTSSSSTKELKYMNVLPLEYLSDDQKLKKFMADVLRKVALRREEKSERDAFEKAIQSFERNTKKISNIHRNASPSSGSNDNSQSVPLQQKKNVDMTTYQALNDYFVDERKKLLSILPEDTNQ